MHLHMVEWLTTIASKFKRIVHLRGSKTNNENEKQKSARDKCEMPYDIILMIISEHIVKLYETKLVYFARNFNGTDSCKWAKCVKTFEVLLILHNSTVRNIIVSSHKFTNIRFSYDKFLMKSVQPNCKQQIDNVLLLAALLVIATCISNNHPSQERRKKKRKLR